MSAMRQVNMNAGMSGDVHRLQMESGNGVMHPESEEKGSGLDWKGVGNMRINDRLRTTTMCRVYMDVGSVDVQGLPVR